MNRREALKVMGGSLAVAGDSAWIFPAGLRDKNFGILPPGRRFRLPRFYSVFTPMKGLALQQKRNTFLWQNLQKEIGEIVPHWQGRDPEDGSEGEGDCVGHASAMAMDVLAATQIHKLGVRESWKAKASVEMIYAGSRVEIGENAISVGGGSRGEWAAKYLSRYGVLHRLNYDVGGQTLDLSGYSPARSRQYRNSGVPDWLEPVARQHPVATVTQVRTGMEALDAVCAGQPVLMCSSYAFHDTRDADGFAAAYLDQVVRRGWRLFTVRVKWYHAMVLTGALVEGDRIGGGIQNSHGDWNSGPRPHDLPRGAFFVELDVLDRMVKDWFDCWAFSSYHGFEAKRIKHKLYWGD